MQWMTPDPELAEDWTLAISQSAHADLTHLQLILRQNNGSYRPTQIFIQQTETSNGKNMGAVNSDIYTVSRSTWKWGKIRTMPLRSVELGITLRWIKESGHPSWTTKRKRWC